MKPPLWHGGKVYLHVILDEQRKQTRDIDVRVLQAVADLGWLDAADLEIAEPDELTIGYPSAKARP